MSNYLTKHVSHRKIFGCNFYLLSAFILMVSVSAMQVSAQTLPAGFHQVLVASNIFNPTTLTVAPDGRIFVAQQNGTLRVVKNGSLLATPFITLNVDSNGERGLLGIAFHPNFATNHFIYLYYTVASGANNRISRFTANGDVAKPNSEFVILNLDPLSGATNHNGGAMHFGKDGKLYVGVGDNADGANAQNLDTYKGKLLRINANGTIPVGNPFTTGSNQRRSVWSYGLRNPYTFAIKPGTKKIFVNDVGNYVWEEINDCTIGGLNYGWPYEEGVVNNSTYTNPIYAYAHGSGISNGCAINGGIFFNPATTNYPAMYTGKYFFMDFCNNWIDKLALGGATIIRTNFASSIAGYPTGLDLGKDGNIYFASRSTHSLYKITYTGPARLEEEANEESMFENSDQLNFSFYPNPASENVNINIQNNSGKSILKITDLAGKLIRESTINESPSQTIYTGDLKAGMYFITVESQNGTLTKKLILE